MNKNIIITLGVTLAVLLIAANAMAGCTIYKNKNFLGASKDIAAGQEISVFERGWDNQITSVKVSSGCQLTVWQKKDFKGKKQEFAENAQNVGNRWNDIASSAKCSCQQAD